MRLSAGIWWCLTFLVLDAVQAVYCGGIFQRLDSFGFGAIVFGVPAAAAIGFVWLAKPGQLEAALKARASLVWLNVTTAGAWLAYFLAIQLIEPAVAFTLFSGTIPLAALVAARLGFDAPAEAGGALARAGHMLLAAGMVALAVFTLAGWSGFVRGGVAVALAGLALSAVAGALITGMLLSSHGLVRAGVGPLAQFGLRFPLYTVLALAGFALGIDAKPETVTALPDYLFAVAVGFAVLSFPIYAVQQAVALTSTTTIAAFAAAGPLVVFGLQMVEGRVDYSTATLAGLVVYFAGALTAALAGTLSGLRRARAAQGR
ncbi:MAG: hypothetical protein VYD64_10800 [Pseudomonadota bacterium]|nr:hypothetical protein [Pseudomonadota bacterium]